MNIVNFWAPRPEHPFFQDYGPFVALTRASAERFGHRHITLTDDPSVADDAYVVDLPRPLMPAFLTAQTAYLSDPAMAMVPTLLTGADCVLIKDPVAFHDPDADIVITVGPFADCRMNMGAVYIHRPWMVAQVWRNALAHCGEVWGDDQRSVLAAIDVARGMGLRVKELPVDPWNLAPEHPGEDCSRGYVLHFRGPRKRWMVDYCHQNFGLGDGIVVRAAPNSEISDVSDHVAINAARDLPWVPGADAHAGHAVLVGGGPSLAETMHDIKWRQSEGQHIFALNGTAAYLMEHGITPDFGVILDPRAENSAFITGSFPWLLASQCHPDVFEAACARAHVWHFAENETAAAIPAEKQSRAVMIGGGITVGLTAMGLTYFMGYREMHLYGYDSSDRNAEGHAYTQNETDAERKRVEVWVGDKRFVAGVAMFAQAKAFQEWASLLAENGVTITVHGDGLLPEIARNMQQTTIHEELAA